MIYDHTVAHAAAFAHSLQMGDPSARRAFVETKSRYIIDGDTKEEKLWQILESHSRRDRDLQVEAGAELSARAGEEILADLVGDGRMVLRFSRQRIPRNDGSRTYLSGVVSARIVHTPKANIMNAEPIFRGRLVRLLEKPDCLQVKDGAVTLGKGSCFVAAVGGATTYVVEAYNGIPLRAWKASVSAPR